MADSQILLSDGISKLVLSNGEYLNLSDQFDEPDINMIFGGLRDRQIHKQAIPMSIRVHIRSKLYVNNTTALSILSRVFIPSILKIPIISSLLSIPSTRLKLESKLKVKQKESVSIKGQQSYKEFYRTIQQLEEMV